jgi:hypothetical protein
VYFGDTEPKAKIFMQILDRELTLFTGRYTNVLPHDILYFNPFKDCRKCIRINIYSLNIFVNAHITRCKQHVFS